MPRLNSRGNVLGGIAGGVTSIDNIELVPGRCCGNWEWLHDSPDGAAGQVCGDAVSGNGCRMTAQDGTLLVNEGAYYFAAGNGRWCSRLDSLRSNFLDVAGNPDEFAHAVPLKGSLEGDIALLMRWDMGANPRIYVNGGAQVDIPVTLGTTTPFSLRNGLATFNQQGQGFRVFDYRAGVEVAFARLNDSDWMVAVRASNGNVYLLERLSADASLRVRRSDLMTGVIVATWQDVNHQTFQPDLVVLGTGTQLKAAWGLTQREAAGEYASLVVDCAAVDAAGSGGVPPTTPGAPLNVSVVTASGAVVSAPADVQAALSDALAGSSMSGDIKTVLLIVGVTLLAVYLGE